MLKTSGNLMSWKSPQKPQSSLMHKSILHMEQYIRWCWALISQGNCSMTDIEMMSYNCTLYGETMTLTMLIKLMRIVPGKCGPLELPCWTSSMTSMHVMSVTSLRAVFKGYTDLQMSKMRLIIWECWSAVFLFFHYSFYFSYMTKRSK